MRLEGLDMSAKNNEGKHRSKRGYSRRASIHCGSAYDPGDRKLHRRRSYLAPNVDLVEVNVAGTKGPLVNDRLGATTPSTKGLRISHA
jgi:hypothetical protein